MKILIRRREWAYRSIYDKGPRRWCWLIGVTPDCEKAFRCYLSSVWTRENNSLKSQFGVGGKQMAAVSSASRAPWQLWPISSSGTRGTDRRARFRTKIEKFGFHRGCNDRREPG